MSRYFCDQEDAANFALAEPIPGADPSVVLLYEAPLDREAHVQNYTARIGFEPEARSMDDTGAMGVQQASF